MSSSSFEALRRANPRTVPGFRATVDAAAAEVRERITTAAPDSQPVVAQRRLTHFSVVGAAAAVAAAVAVSLTVGSSGRGPAVADATAAVRQAAKLSAASAERSGTAVVRITRDGELWAASTVRWAGNDLAVSQQAPRRRGRPGSELRLVAGTLYGVDSEEGGWVVLGSPESIDPGSGTTPDEHLAAVREDVGGVTLRRITAAMNGLTARRLADGSSLYTGRVAAGVIARETGVKGGRPIRVLPLGYVAHGEAADAASPLDTAVTVGADGIVRRIEVTWGTWRYTVTYSALGATPPPVAPANARPLRDRPRAGG